MGRRNVLGRGLNALIPRQEQGYREVALDDIVPDRTQPRVRFDEEALADMAESIKAHGVLQPLVVSSPDENGKHRLIVGERRWQAARMAQLERVPVIERDVTSEAAMEIALVENLQRQDLDPLEEAAAFERLIREYGLSQAQVGERVGRSRSGIANSLRLLGLPEPARQALIEGHISEGHARGLLGLEDPTLIENILSRVLAEDLTVRQTEALVARLKQGKTQQRSRPPEQPPELQMLEDQLRQSLGTKVSLQQGRKRGRVIIEYYSQEDLDSLLQRLLGP